MIIKVGKKKSQRSVRTYNDIRLSVTFHAAYTIHIDIVIINAYCFMNILLF